VEAAPQAATLCDVIDVAISDGRRRDHAMIEPEPKRVTRVDRVEDGGGDELWDVSFWASV
jgi:hypothetical protein